MMKTNPDEGDIRVSAKSSIWICGLIFTILGLIFSAGFIVFISLGDTYIIGFFVVNTFGILVNGTLIMCTNS